MVKAKRALGKEELVDSALIHDDAGNQYLLLPNLETVLVKRKKRSGANRRKR